MGHWIGYGMDWWMWGLMFLGIVGFWVVVLVILRVLIQGKSGDSSTHPPAGRDPLLLLDERLARGEIDTDEYQRTRNVLTGAH